MPYVSKQVRKYLDRGFWEPETTGELTYVLYREVMNWVRAPEDGPNFERYSQAIAALECAKMELYRRHVAPYENLKLEENGDV